jgi:hypothetical protein
MAVCGNEMPHPNGWPTLAALSSFAQLSELTGRVSTPESGGNQVVLDREQDQVRVAFEVERLHDVVFVEHNRSLADS